MLHITNIGFLMVFIQEVVMIQTASLKFWLVLTKNFVEKYENYNYATI